MDWNAITAISTFIYTILTFGLAVLTYWNISTYRKDKKIDEDKKLAITQLKNLYKLTTILVQYKTINEQSSQLSYNRHILYFMQNCTEQKDFEYIKKCIKAMKDGKASSFKQHFVGLLEKFQKQTIDTIDDFISNNKQTIKKNCDTEEDNLKEALNKSNELTNKIQDLNTEIEMHTMLLTEKAIKINKYLCNLCKDIFETSKINRSNIKVGTSLAPYPAIDFIIDIKATLALNLKYIHNTDNFSLEKWQKNWQELKIEETKDNTETANTTTNTTPPTN